MSRTFWNRYRQYILYLVFGVGTTVCNIVSYWFLSKICGWYMLTANIVAGVLSIAFAYVTNKLWVFESKSTGIFAVLREAVAFYSCRLAVSLLDIGIMFLGIEILHIDDLVVKCVANAIVIVLNYVASKKIIFK